MTSPGFGEDRVNGAWITASLERMYTFIDTMDFEGDVASWLPNSGMISS